MQSKKQYLILHHFSASDSFPRLWRYINLFVCMYVCTYIKYKMRVHYAKIAIYLCFRHPNPLHLTFFNCFFQLLVPSVTICQWNRNFNISHQQKQTVFSKHLDASAYVVSISNVLHKLSLHILLKQLNKASICQISALHKWFHTSI